ncbi:MAG: TIGR03560 family F420-dependent LLM class oxidoreductase [Chloroflexota bacterium]
MRFALMTEPQQGLTYDELLALVHAAEAAGIESFLRSDHYASFPGEAGLPTTDAWATLAGLARETSRITLGALVSPVTFRQPGNVAKLVATVDEMSGGRVEVGIGAGWHRREHEAYGFGFPSLKERYELLEESLAVIHGLWTEPDGWSYAGRRVTVLNAQFVTKPARNGRRHPPIILGGEGGPKMARLAATYADEINIVSATPERARNGFAAARAACARIGRDPDALTYSAMTGVLVAETESELRERVAAQLAFTGETDEGDADAWLAERRTRWVMGTPEQAWERIRELERAGVERIMLQDFLPRDLDHVATIGRLIA